jgi:hypothetical protein
MKDAFLSDKHQAAMREQIESNIKTVLVYINKHGFVCDRYLVHTKKYIGAMFVSRENIDNDALCLFTHVDIGGFTQQIAMISEIVGVAENTALHINPNRGDINDTTQTLPFQLQILDIQNESLLSIKKKCAQ